jgi:hypothetical protein
MAMQMLLVFCGVMPCGLADRYQCFTETYCLYLHGRWRQHVPKNNGICLQIHMALHQQGYPHFLRLFCHITTLTDLEAH